MTMIGIYCIWNKNTKRKYIGSSFNIEKRFKTHIKSVLSGSHHNVFFQRDFDKYCKSKKDLQFTIIEKFEKISKSDLFAIEQSYIDICENLYNIGAVGGGDNITKHPNYDEICKRISVTTKRYFDTLTKDEYYEKKVLPKLGSKNGMYGKNHTNETKQKIIDTKIKNGTYGYVSTKGKTFDDIYGVEKATHLKKNLSCAAKERTGEKNPFYGKKHTEETKRKLSECKRGKKNEYRIYKIIKPDGNELVIKGISKLKEELGVSATIISKFLNKGKIVAGTRKILHYEIITLK